jgi:hypothetical protein
MNWRSTSNNQSMGACEGAFLLCILRKQHCPLALQTMNCTPADYQLHLPAAYPVKAAPPFGSSINELHSCRLSIAEKAWGKQLTGTEQHSTHCLV